MQGERLESEEDKAIVNINEGGIKNHRKALGGIELAHHTDEELQNIPYVEGLTMEELQAQQTGKKSFKHVSHGDEKHSNSTTTPLKHLGTSAEKNQKKRKMKTLINNMRPILRLCALTYQLSHTYLMVVFIAPTFSDPFVVWMVRVFCLFIYLTTTYSYHLTGYIPSLSLKRTKDKGFMPRSGYKDCNRCNDIWKPDRTHHCSIQKHCVTRMDHYCPITLTTIGMRNHGAFFMTSVGHALSCLMWVIFYPIYYCYNFKELLRGSLYWFLIMTGVGFADFLCILSIFALSIGITFSHLVLIFNNATTLEGVSGEQTLFKEVRKKGSYNMSPLYNLRQFYSVAFGLLPFQGSYDANKYEGYYFHKVGETKEEFSMKADTNDFHMFGGTRLELRDDQIPVIGHKLYDGIQLVLNGEGRSSLAKKRERLEDSETALQSTSINDSAI